MTSNWIISNSYVSITGRAASCLPLHDSAFDYSNQLRWGRGGKQIQENNDTKKSAAVASLAAITKKKKHHPDVGNRK